MRLVLALLLLLLAAPGPRAETPMAAAADPRAAEAALQILRKGGSAVDAAIAAQMVLTLVEPQSSGIGGGAFLMHFDAGTGEVSSWDGRETAPAAARADLFLGPDGAPISFDAAKLGGRAVGVPGVIAMLAAAHKAFGKLPWADLFVPAIALAERGFVVSPRLAHSIAEQAATLRLQPAARNYFLDDAGQPLRAGVRHTNPALAKTLRAIAAGPENFYRGPIAAAIVGAVRGDATPGSLNIEDLAAYRPLPRAPVCAPYRLYVLCGMGPPSSGGITVLQSLRMLERFPLAGRSFAEPEIAHLLLQAELIAWADRDRYLADPAYVRQPMPGLLDPAYLVGRSALIDPAHALDNPPPGIPPGFSPLPPQLDQREPGTSQLCVVDARGNAVSMTTTVNDAFGARLLVGGFLLNDELTDFSFAPRVDGALVANRVEPGKRPRSSMAPFIILDGQHGLVGLVGSVGGARIIGFVAQALVELIDFGKSPAQAAAAAHLGVLGSHVELEAGTDAARLADPLRAIGHHVALAEMDSGTQIIMLGPVGPRGGADPRREGVALSEDGALSPVR